MSHKKKLKKQIIQCKSNEPIPNTYASQIIASTRICSHIFLKRSQGPPALGLAQSVKASFVRGSSLTNKRLCMRSRGWLALPWKWYTEEKTCPRSLLFPFGSHDWMKLAVCLVCAVRSWIMLPRISPLYTALTSGTFCTVPLSPWRTISDFFLFA